MTTRPATPTHPLFPARPTPRGPRRAVAWSAFVLLLAGAGSLPGQEPPTTALPSPSAEAETPRGWIGIAFRDRDGGPGPDSPDRDGVPISGVLRGSPAHRSGIRPGEILLRIEGEPVDPHELAERARGIRVGDSLTLTLGGSYGRREVLLVAGRPPDVRPPLPEARIMARVDSMEEAVRRRMEALRERMREEPDDSLPRSGGTLRFFDDDAPEPSEVRPDDPARDAPPRRPPLLYSLGVEYVAGARMVDLNPSLAEYFGVEEGVLAVEVLAEGPAAESGLLPGDVIVAVGDRGIDSVDELRGAVLEGRRGSTVLDVIRKGRQRTIALD